jgi:undecaprenyl-diphosphatase
LEEIEGESLEGRGAEGITDDNLRAMWGVAAELQAHNLAHRDLRLAHLLVDSRGEVKSIDFSFAELAAQPTQMRTDSAELLCATAVEVGPERAVAAAVEVLGKEAIGDASSRLQPLALTSHTRRAVAAQKDLLEDLQAEVQRAAGLEEVEYEELARIKPRTVVTVIVLAVAVYALLPRLADVGGIREQLANATWVWLIPVVFFQCTTYFGAAMGMVGSVPDRVAFFPTVRAQIAAAFVDVLTPAGLGGMTLNTRFMQRRGVDPAVAVAGVGVNAVGGIIGHVLLLGLFLLWAGTTSLDSATGGQQPTLQMPPWQIFVGILALVVLLGLLTYAIPAGRRYLRERIRPLITDAFAGLAQLARRPAKLVEVVGGSMIVTLGFTFAFVCTVQAFGGGIPIAQLGVAYLAAWAVAVFAPTPGGLGALEIALIAALNRLGMPNEAAVSSTLVFRTFTFWLPVLPGWLTFTWLQRTREI